MILAYIDIAIIGNYSYKIYYNNVHFVITVSVGQYMDECFGDGAATMPPWCPILDTK